MVGTGWRERRGKPSILLSLSCVCLQRTPIEGGWRGTRVQDLSVAEVGGGTVTEKYLEVDARGARRGYAKKETSRSGEEGGRGSKKKIREFSRRRVEWLGGRIIELPLIPSSPRYPRVKRGKRSPEEAAHREKERDGASERGEGGGATEAKDEADEERVEGPRGGQDGRSWFVCRRRRRRRRRVGNRRTGIEGMITFVSYLTLERAG